MRAIWLAIRSLVYFRRKNLALATGVAITTIVITGSLIVGDSVQYSLHAITSKRLGDISLVVDCGDRYVTTDLVDRMAAENDVPVSGLLLTDGMAVSGGGRLRINQVNIIGVDAAFDRMGRTSNRYAALEGDSVIISENLAERLDLSPGDEFLVRMERARLVPSNAPFVSDAENLSSLRVMVQSIAADNEMGAFNLKTSQTAPFNLFINGNRLRNLMEMEGYVNFILFRNDNNLEPADVRSQMHAQWKLKDAGLDLIQIATSGEYQVSSPRVFIDSSTSAALENISPSGYPVLTYFVNSLSKGRLSTPYSFISSQTSELPGTDGIVINSWLADDLDAAQGDTLSLKYFEIGPLRELKEDSVSLVVQQIIPVTDDPSAKLLMPEIPGLSDAGNCRDWETGVPIRLESIRDKDEDYWTRYKGTPKGFIPYDLAAGLWGNRFGYATAFRFPSDDISAEGLEEAILSSLRPEDLGITVVPVRERAAFAASNGVDFTELFLGLSFFLLVGGIILTILLFLLALQERQEQIGILTSAGIPSPIIRNTLLMEWALVALAGVLAGTLLSIGYNRILFHAMNSVWADIVRSDMMQVHIKASTLVLGGMISLTVAVASLIIPLRRFLKRIRYQHAAKGAPGVFNKWRKGLAWIALLAFLVASGLVVLQIIQGSIHQSGPFFLAGGLLLIAGVSFFLYLLSGKKNSRSTGLSIWQLSYRNALRNRSRSIGIILLFAIGTFLVISTGANRKDLFQDATDRTSGTGGFLYYAESTVPVLNDLNVAEVRFKYSLESAYSIVQLRLAEGDDASCLNLNRIVNPAIVGIEPANLQGRFSFVTQTPYLDEEQPWLSLESNLPGGLIPAIADETVIKWGLGMQVGDTLVYTNGRGEEMKLLLIGGLAPSIFQGRVIISNTNFLAQYPSSSGSNVFLVDGALSDTAAIKEELNMGMRDMGWNMTYAPERLAEFNSVTNTYLSIFLVLGAIGLMLGTVGLAILLYRSVLERREELAVLRATGFSLARIRGLLIREYTGLFLAGTLTGFFSAMIATLPSILSSHTEVSSRTIGIVLVLMLVNGLFWTWVLAGAAIRGRSIYEALRNE
jgi:ABC-type antimicrobial peptide transport system permease subunit